MVAVSAVDSHALEAVAMMAARLLARAVVTGFTHLTQKFQLDLERFFLLALAIKVVLQDGQSFPSIFISIAPLYIALHRIFIIAGF